MILTTQVSLSIGQRAISAVRIKVHGRLYSSSVQPQETKDVVIQNSSFKRDDYTNVTEKIISHIGRNLHTQPYHPLCLVRKKIVNFFYKNFLNSRGNPVFSAYDNINPIVSVQQNFDSLLIPPDHPSRKKSDCYYINENYLLRAHTTAHQADLIQSGLNNFLVSGDVYRRDEIDNTHYPVFHQLDGVRLKAPQELFKDKDCLEIFEDGCNTQYIDNGTKQACHTIESVKLMECELKSTLTNLAMELFGKDVEYRWIDTYFPFTEPSWELEVQHHGKWLEVLGCGIMKQEILGNAGVQTRIGWAFGLGLERIAMHLYQIPDIRLFWSRDSGFLNQFIEDDADKKIIYKPVSQYPQCTNDISFWLPKTESEFTSNDFYDLVRNVGGDIVEQVVLIDEFTHPKNGNVSHCYRIYYRHMEKTLSQNEVNAVHKQIEEHAVSNFGVTIR